MKEAVLQKDYERRTERGRKNPSQRGKQVLWTIQEVVRFGAGAQRMGK